MSAADTTNTTNTLKLRTAVGEGAQRGKADWEKNLRNRERKLMVDMDRITREIPR